MLKTKHLSRFINYLLIIIINIYYCKSKKIPICQSCYEDFYLEEEVFEIEDDKKARHTVSKIQKWMDVMRKHGEKYNITEIHPHHFNDLKDYSDKLMNISLKLQEAQETERFLQY